MRFNTALLHSAKLGDENTGATLTPIYQSSAFYQPSAEQHEKLFHNKATGYSYTRINNPTIAAFEERMTNLEKGVGSVACSSGMAALTNALLNIVGTGGEIVSSTGLYGGTIDLFHDLEAFGIKTTFVEISDKDAVEAAINENTRVIFAETIGNPKLDVVEACEDVVLLSEDDADSDHDHDHDADAESDSDHDHDHEADTESDSDHEADIESDSTHEHDHGDENAHAWMSVPRYRTMVQTIASRLAEKDAKHADEYYANAKAYDAKLAVLEEKINSIKSLTNGQNIIIFHEAYAYVADDFSMNACYLLDLDEERSVSAGEIKQVIGAIKDDGVSVILAEELYGKSMGDTVSRETDVHVIYIDPLNRGEYDKDSYLYGMEHNIELIKEAFTK